MMNKQQHICRQNSWKVGSGSDQIFPDPTNCSQNALRGKCTVEANVQQINKIVLNRFSPFKYDKVIFFKKILSASFCLWTESAQSTYRLNNILFLLDLVSWKYFPVQRAASMSIKILSPEASSTPKMMADEEAARMLCTRDWPLNGGTATLQHFSNAIFFFCPSWRPISGCRTY